MRNFDPRVERFAPDWRRETCTNDPEWKLRPDLGSLSSATSPIWVSCSLTVGVAKPSKAGAVPFAAQEKIASDLAFDLRLPVPPVILWDRGPQQSGDCQHVAISAVPFPQPREWSKVKSDAALMAVIRPKMVASVSAMCVFDAWLHNNDHHDHPGNLLLSLGTEPEPTLHVAYIDYSHSLLNNWPGDEWNGTFCPPIYDPACQVDLVVARNTIQSIEGLEEQPVREIVERIPDAYISPAQKAKLASGLLDRKSRLSDIVKTQLQI
jgi:hypothetical protein